jgi:hypothetical protein
MLLLPVLMSRLGVLWHREHLANSGGDIMPKLNEEDELLEDMESSLVTWRTFCCGTGRGLLAV